MAVKPASGGGVKPAHVGGIPLKPHVHRPKTSKDVGYSHCVAYAGYSVCHPNTHGNITRVDTCRCGAVRYTNINANDSERSPWIVNGEPDIPD